MLLDYCNILLIDVCFGRVTVLVSKINVSVLRHVQLQKILLTLADKVVCFYVYAHKINTE